MTFPSKCSTYPDRAPKRVRNLITGEIGTVVGWSPWDIPQVQVSGGQPVYWYYTRPMRFDYSIERMSYPIESPT